MNDFESPRLEGKSLEQLVEELGTGHAGRAHSAVFEMYKAAIQVRLAERLAAPKRWAIVAAVAAAISAAAAVVSAIAGF